MTDDPILDTVVWMKCPYPEELCVEPATWEFVTVSSVDESVEGIAVCAAGHRWRISKLPNEAES